MQEHMHIKNRQILKDRNYPSLIADFPKERERTSSAQTDIRRSSTVLVHIRQRKASDECPQTAKDTFINPTTVGYYRG